MITFIISASLFAMYITGWVIGYFAGVRDTKRIWE